MGLCWKSFKMGLGLGLAGKPLPLAKKEPIAYLYNGVRLPKLPEWDREMYPYAVIGDHGASWPPAVWCLSADAYYELNNDNLWLKASAGRSWKLEDGKWSEYEENAGNAISVLINSTSWSSTYELIWTNFNAEYNGTLYLAASEPIPVYE